MPHQLVLLYPFLPVGSSAPFSGGPPPSYSVPSSARENYYPSSESVNLSSGRPVVPTLATFHVVGNEKDPTPPPRPSGSSGGLNNQMNL